MITKGVNVDNLIEASLRSLDRRAAEVVSHRYGINSEDRRTLADLGSKHGLTRERIRQIEAGALLTAREAIGGHPEAAQFTETIDHYLGCVGGVRRSDMLVRDIQVLWGVDHPEELFSNKLHFLADVLEKPVVIRSNSEWHRTWHNDEAAYEKARRVVTHLLESEKHDFDHFLRTTTQKLKLPESVVLNYVSISKQFAVGPYGHLGARHWMHVNPKTVRDKSYLVLWRAGRPMHFREIAEQVNELKRVKKAHPATVHNELIKDPRFVLVGRGVYALKDE